MEELNETIRETISKSHILNTLCVAFDENDERKIIENTFFKLYLYNEYTNDIFNTDKYLHFRDILINNKIILEELYTPKKLTKDTRDELTALIQNISDDVFNKYLTSDDKNNLEFDSINNNLGLLGLTNKSNIILTEYKDIITNKYLLTEHFNLLRLLKNDAFIKDSLERKCLASYKTKLIKSTEHKILLLRKLEATYNIEPLQVNFDKIDTNFRLFSHLMT